MGANRERFNALTAAVMHLPHRSNVLAHRFLFGNSALTNWVLKTQLEKRNPIVIVMIERLGDLIACSSIAKHLKTHDPMATIAWVCSKRFGDVFRDNPFIDAVFHEESLASWLLTKRRLSKPYVAVELFLDTQRCCWTGMKLPGRRSGITHYNYLNEGSNLLLAYSRAAGINTIADSEPDLYACVTNIDLPKSHKQGPLMVIHFDSEDPDRRVNRNSAVRFAEQAICKGWKIIELGVRPVVSPIVRNVYFPGHSIGLVEHLALVRQANHFVGVDSAFLHAANAYRTPATLMLGKFRHFTQFQTFSGQFFHSPQCRIYRGDSPMADVSPDILEKLVPEPPTQI